MGASTPSQYGRDAGEAGALATGLIEARGLGRHGR